MTKTANSTPTTPPITPPMIPPSSLSVDNIVINDQLMDAVILFGLD